MPLNGRRHSRTVQQAIPRLSRRRQGGDIDHVILVRAEPPGGEGEIPPVMTQPAVVRPDVFPRPVLHGELTKAHPPLRDVVPSVVPRDPHGVLLVKHRSAPHGNIERVVHQLTVNINAVGDIDLNRVHECASSW